MSASADLDFLCSRFASIPTSTNTPTNGSSSQLILLTLFKHAKKELKSLSTSIWFPNLVLEMSTIFCGFDPFETFHNPRLVLCDLAWRRQAHLTLTTFSSSVHSSESQCFPTGGRWNVAHSHRLWLQNQCKIRLHSRNGPCLSYQLRRPSLLHEEHYVINRYIRANKNNFLFLLFLCPINCFF